MLIQSALKRTDPDHLKVDHTLKYEHLRSISGVLKWRGREKDKIVSPKFENDSKYEGEKVEQRREMTLSDAPNEIIKRKNKTEGK